MAWWMQKPEDYKKQREDEALLQPQQPSKTHWSQQSPSVYKKTIEEGTLATAKASAEKPSIFSKTSSKPEIAYGQNWFRKHLGPTLSKPFVALGNIAGWFEETPVGKFLARGSETAGKISYFDKSPNRYSTGSKTADIVADVIGTGVGLIAGPVPGGGVASPAGTALKIGGQGVRIAAAKAPVKLGKYGYHLAEGAGAGAAYGAMKGLAEDKSPGGIAAEAGKEALLFGGLDVAGRAVGEKVIMPVARKVWDRFGKGVVEKVQVAPETVPENVPENVQKTSRPRLTGRLKPKNKALEKAINEYNEAVETVQNHFKTNQLRADEMARIEPELGIDFDRLIRNIEEAEKGVDIRKMAERGRMARVAGVMETPKIKKPSIFKETPVVEKPRIAGKPRLTEPRAETGPLYNVAEMKDTTGFKAHTMDIYRIFRDVFGKRYDKVKKAILDPFDASKKANVEFQHKWLDKLKTEVVDKLGIKKGSKESALVQQYGEGKITLDQLKQMRPKDWEKIVEADKWFRKAYDELLDTVNAIRAKIYPNNPDKIIPKRKDYYRHFREFTDLTGLKNIFETPANIDPNLVYISEFTQPKSKWLSFAQRRTGQGKHTVDAVGGFLNYLPSASYAVHIDPHIGVFEKLAADLAEATGEAGTNTKHLNNFINFLRRFAQDLAGKTNPADRFIQDFIPGGRKTFHALNWLNSRIKANVILGNISSTLAQLANIPHGLAYAKQYSVPGAGRALKSIFVKSGPMSQSGFLLERYGGYGSKFYRQFDVKLLEQPLKAAKWLVETTDKIGTSFIWNSVYSKGLAEGVANPVKYADDITRNLVAGRGIGEVPLLQKSKMYQMFLPFTLELANAWRVMKDFVSAKDFGGLAILLVANHLFNKGMEELKGSGVVFDPIQAMIDAFSEEDISPLQRAGRLAGEVLSNVPAGQTIASIYPEYGTSIYGYELPTRKELFGRNDPTRFGVGLPGVISKGLSDPFYKILPPFGGGQIQKTIRGIRALQNQGVYTEDKTQLKYPVETDTANIIRGSLFGTSAFPETREYYDQNRRPLSEKQTKQYLKGVESGKNPKALYENIQKRRALDRIEEEIMKIKKDERLTPEEKMKYIEGLQKKIQQLIAQR